MQLSVSRKSKLEISGKVGNFLLENKTITNSYRSNVETIIYKI